eukprot:112282-Karenia_brevis.AAC.1
MGTGVLFCKRRILKTYAFLDLEWHGAVQTYTELVNVQSIRTHTLQAGGRRKYPPIPIPRFK